MVKQKIFSFEAIAELCDLNKRLGQLTGIDFCRNMITIANSEHKTEIDAREFIKKNYPIKNLSEQDIEDIMLLIDFYSYWSEYREQDAAPSYCVCQILENPDEKPFRSRCLENFPIPEEKLEFVTGFFPKD